MSEKTEEGAKNHCHNDCPQFFAFGSSIKKSSSRCSCRVWFLFTVRAFGCFPKQIAGEGAYNSCGGGQVLINLGSYHCPLVKQLGGKYE